MIDDNYSDDMGGNGFEEEYLDEDLEESKGKLKSPIKNDFWDPPKKTTVAPSLTSNQKNTNANVT